jgi:putative mycofactocin binding protein MftB
VVTGLLGGAPAGAVRCAGLPLRHRKLSFLKSKTLVAVVESLADHPTAAAALTACGVGDAQRPAYEKALADLARSRMIEVRTQA